MVLKAVRPARFHLIDPWRFVDDNRYHSALYGGSFAKSQHDMDAIYQGVIRRFESAIATGVVTIHRCESAEVADTFPDSYFDWVYIDGNHLYEYVQSDLTTFGTKVKYGGLLAGDDYANEGWWKDGVRQAVDQFLEASEYTAVSLSDQFILRRGD